MNGKYWRVKILRVELIILASRTEREPESVKRQVTQNLGAGLQRTLLFFRVGGPVQYHKYKHHLAM